MMIGQGGRGIDVIRSGPMGPTTALFPVIIAGMHQPDKRATCSLEVRDRPRGQRLQRPGGVDCRQETNPKHVR